jgi:hypothetical protein
MRFLIAIVSTRSKSVEMWREDCDAYISRLQVGSTQAGPLHISAAVSHGVGEFSITHSRAMKH